ncbi:MAG: AAA family ATPase [Chloroflexota bacterium]|nr:AAA family ATPase [Chloroflexota bacterium]
MITQIEIDGFKTFKDFKVELAPFQVIVGPNGASKSNLFDALHLLSRLVDLDLRSALQGPRGNANELFTAFPDGNFSNYIDIKVEMLVDRKVTDGYGDQVELKYTRLRYELKIAFSTDNDGIERLFIMHESLKGIALEQDKWTKQYIHPFERDWLPPRSSCQAIFIDKALTKDGTAIVLHKEGRNKGRNKQRSFLAEKAERSVLSSVTTTEHPHAFAARQEILFWRFLHLLNLDVLRTPSSVKAPGFLSEDGKNLAAMLARIGDEDPLALRDLSLDMANLVPGVLTIKIERDLVDNEYTVKAQAEDGRVFSSRVLSDGTLRLLALTAICNDPTFHGVIGIEEPENGVHPFQLKYMARLLRGTATDFKDLEQVNEPLRQVLVTTHSPVFICQPQVIDSLLFALTVLQVQPGDYSLSTTHMVPVVPSDLQAGLEEENYHSKAERSYSIHQVLKYLDTDLFDKARANFDEGCSSIQETSAYRFRYSL